MRGQAAALWLIGSGHPPGLTDSIDLVHENDTGLVISGVIEHLSDQPRAFADVLVHYGARHHLVNDNREGRE